MLDKVKALGYNTTMYYVSKRFGLQRTDTKALVSGVDNSGYTPCYYLDVNALQVWSTPFLAVAEAIVRGVKYSVTGHDHPHNPYQGKLEVVELSAKPIRLAPDTRHVCRDKEDWAQLPAYPQYYISSTGRILHDDGHTIRELVTVHNRHGRWEGSVSVTDHCGQILHTTPAQLVAQAYIPNPNQYYRVGHRDGDARHNQVSNLYWINGL